MEGFVYLLQAGPYYKIGRSNDIDQRIKQLSTLPPFDLNLLHALWCDNCLQVERWLHDKFGDKRIRGEWFTLTPDDLDFVMQLGSFYQGAFHEEDRCYPVYSLGFDACAAGKSLASNPYKTGSRCHKVWNSGHHDCSVARHYPLREQENNL